MVVLSGNAPDSYASPAINFVISKAAFFKLQDHFKIYKHITLVQVPHHLKLMRERPELQTLCVC